MGGSKGQSNSVTQTGPPAPVLNDYYNLLNRAQNVASTPYQQYQGNLVAPFSQSQQTAFNTVDAAQGAAQPYINQAAAYGTLGASPIQASAIGNYFDPYQQSVTSATLGNIKELDAQQQAQLTGRSLGSGGLFNERTGVASAELARQQDLANNQTLATLNMNDWNQALAAAQADRAARGQAAYTFGNLGQENLATILQGAQAQLGTGGQQQQLAQAQLNVPYMQFQQAQAFPYQQTGWLAGLETGVGSQTGGVGSTTYTPAQPNPWNLGVGAGLYGLANGSQIGSSLGSIGSGLGSIGSSLWSGLGTLGSMFLKRGGGVPREGYDDGGGVAPIPFANATSYVPAMSITHGRGPPAAPYVPGNVTDPMSSMLQRLMGGNRGRTTPSMAAPSPYNDRSGTAGTLTPSDWASAVPGGEGATAEDFAASSPGNIDMWRGGRAGYADGGAPDDASDLDLGAMATYRPTDVAGGLRDYPGQFARRYTPGLYNYLTAERPPPPTTPNPAGKLPTGDPYAGPALEDVRNIGMMAIPFGRAEALAERAGETALGAARPFAGETAGAVRGVGDIGASLSTPVAAGAAGLGSMGTPSPAQATETSQRTRDAVEKALGPRPEIPDLEKALGPRPTILPDEQAEIDKLTGQIKDIGTARDNAIAAISDKQKAAIDRAIRRLGPGPGKSAIEAATTAASAPFEPQKDPIRKQAADQISPLSAQISTINSQVNGRQSDYDDRGRSLSSDTQKRQLDYDDKAAAFLKSTAPFPAREPEQQKWFSRAPLIAGATGFFPSLAGGKLPFGKQMGLAGTMGALGAAEGGVGALYPVMEDLKQPEGSEARVQAERNLGDPNFWLKQVGGEMGLAVASSMAGSGVGMKTGKTVGDAMDFVKSLLGKGAPAASTAAATAAPVAKAARVYPDLKDAAAVSRYQSTLKQDKAGRWYEPGKGMVSKEYWPLSKPAASPYPGNARGGAVENAMRIARRIGGQVRRGYDDGGAALMSPVEPVDDVAARSGALMPLPAMPASVADDLPRGGDLPRGAMMPIMGPDPRFGTNDDAWRSGYYDPTGQNASPRPLEPVWSDAAALPLSGSQMATPAPAASVEPGQDSLASAQPLEGPGVSRQSTAPQSRSIAPFASRVQAMEGFQPKATWDYRQWTNGYGTRAAYPGEVIDRNTAQRRFDNEFSAAGNIVDQVNPRLDPGTRAALTSLTFNTGGGWANGRLGQAVRAGDTDAIRSLMGQYVHAGGNYLPGLASRRAEEASWLGQDAPPGGATNVASSRGAAGIGLGQAAPYSGMTGSPDGRVADGGGGGWLSPKMRDALSVAGLSLMASRSPWFGPALGEAGLAGMQTYRGEEQQEYQRGQAERKEKLDEDRVAAQSKRLDDQIALAHERENRETKAQAATEQYRQDELNLRQQQAGKPPPEMQWADEAHTTLKPIKGGKFDPDVIKAEAEARATGQSTGKAAGTPQITGLSDEQREIQANQIASGNLSPLTGLPRTPQGLVIRNALRSDAAQIIMKQHPDWTPGQVADHLNRQEQNFKSAQIGLNAGARTAGTREANLNIILSAADAAVPAALDASRKVQRTGIVPLNRIIQKGEINFPAISGEQNAGDLIEFGMSNLQLAEHWARAMNPTGVMRESDRDKALTFLDTALTNNTYERAVKQLQVQITRERDAVRGQNPNTPINPNARVPEPGDVGGVATDPLAEARAAISAGKPRDLVIKRLQEHGIDPTGL